jgi:hypothetical protein
LGDAVLAADRRQAWWWCRRRSATFAADFITAAPTGSGPDIILGAHDWIGELNASGLLAPVELGPNAANFAPNAVQAFTFTDGKIYGMPQATENIALIYNTDLVPTPPTTFDEVKTMSLTSRLPAPSTVSCARSATPITTTRSRPRSAATSSARMPTAATTPRTLGLNSEGSVAALSGSTACTPTVCWIATPTSPAT